MRGIDHKLSRCGLVPDPPRSDEMPDPRRDLAGTEVAPGSPPRKPGAATCCPLRALVLRVQREMRLERRRARRRAYALANRERILELQRRRRAAKRAAANAERRAAYARNREQHRREARKYYERNREVCLQRRRAAYALNRQEQTARERERYFADRKKRVTAMRDYYYRRGKFLRAGVAAPDTTRSAP